MSTSSKDPYFKELKEWSDRKLKLLEYYLDPATKILASIRRWQQLTKVYYIDGFAGAGTYEDGGKGSPVRAAELARQYRDQGKSYSLKCINVEERRGNFENLQQETLRFGNLVLNFFGTFAANVTPILNEIRDVPSVCFLDPFGVEGLDWDAVVKMIQRPGPTDFWIRFDAEYVLRLDGFYRSMAPEAPAKRDILMRTYGIPDIDHIHARLSGATPEDRKQRAVDLYSECLRSAFTNAKGEGYAASYRIRTLEEEDKYHLVFATANKKGIVLASNVVCNIEETYQRELQEYKANSTSQTSMFAILGFQPSEDEIFASKVEELKKEIWAMCRSKKEGRRDIHAHLVTNSHWFGKMKHPHMTQAFKGLHTEGKIVSMDGTFGDEDSVFTFQA